MFVSRTVKISETIRKIIGFVSILVFAFAMAPKQLLHDAITVHKHQFSHSSHDSKLDASGFHCDCDNLVVETAFISFADPIVINPRLTFTSIIYPSANDDLPAYYSTFRLRGPPCSL